MRLRQLWVFLTSYPDVLAAAVGFGLLVIAGITSIKIARRHLKYETWWIVHLYMYLALALAFAHQIVTGGSFIGHPLTRAIWIAVWIATAGMVIVFRVVQPVVRSLRHRLRVAAVREEAPGVFSIICSGRKLDRLAVSGGQFFQWRFLTKELVVACTPLLALRAPATPLYPGDRQGSRRSEPRRRPPQGRERAWRSKDRTEHSPITPASSDRVVLIGAGVGITPLRALLEDLPASVDVTVIIRASTPRGHRSP